MATIIVIVAIIVVLLIMQSAGPKIKRQQVQADVRRMLELEEKLGKDHPKVKELRVANWRYMLYGEGHKEDS